MWSANSNSVFSRGTESEGQAPTIPLHNVGQTDENAREPVEGSHVAEDSPHALENVNEEHEPGAEGTWGERDVGGPVNHAAAMEDYEHLRRELSRISTTRSRSSVPERKSMLRTLTERGVHKTTSRASHPTISSADDEDAQSIAKDLEAGDTAKAVEEEFELGQFMREGHFEKRTESGESAKKVGVIFKNLNVKGVGSSTMFVKTLPEAVIGTFGPDLYRLLCNFFPFLRFGNKPPTRDLIHDFSGVVRDGEMMLVLGKPGAGCSTFLKAIANHREGFADVSGDVSYGGISAAEQSKHFRGEVSYNPEDDQHFPNLSVYQTLKFALLNKTKKNDKDGMPVIIDALLKMFGISHTKQTFVGNEYVRGVSGGERKRVSIAETLATKSSVVCWDNSTRGLDASTALDYANSLRIMTDISNRTTLVTLYQAGEGIYELMDKVLVIDSGKMIFQGPAGEAKAYFEGLGFLCPDRQTTADFLTSISDANERRFREGYEARAPKTPEELEKAFLDSPHYQRVLRDVEEYENELHQSDHANARQFKQSVHESKSRTVRNSSNYTVSFPRQILACTKREFWLILGDKTTLYTKAFIIISNALIVGSLFHGQPETTAGAFSRGGTLFFSILFLGWLQLTELMRAVSGRTIIQRHKEYAFYRPSAVTMGRVLADFPILLPQVIVFTIVVYFITNLDVDASKFFIYFLFVYTQTICITSLYRMFASLSPTIDDAVRFAGIALNLLIIYTGYAIPKPQLVHKYIWFGWLNYLNPISYAFESVLTNEFHHRYMDCDPNNLVPQGPNVKPEYQGCSLGTVGSPLGSTGMTGEYYLATEFSYTRHHLWRNFGVLIAWTVLYILITGLASEVFSFVGGGGGALVFKRSKKAKQAVKSSGVDEEKAGTIGDSSPSTMTETDETTKNLKGISQSESIFTWRNVEYTVPYPGGERKLLNNIEGFAKPGVMVALMGASGAGKTTLLNTLAQRQKMGVVGGEMLVDGTALGTEFQRGTGFCEQMDLHDGSATIREALEFSAILRQERTVPTEEKLAYVNQIIDLLELNDIQHAIVGSLGVEQRKRLTIGVELAAKPSLLLFLDEPTSGLDSQSAYSIVRFLRKLADAGQAILCTIHQPSSVLIQQFDMILALNPGGNTFYFGPVGENGSAVIDYFGKRGVHCPPAKNVAEFILETAIKGGKRADGKKLNWNKEWKESAERRAILQEIDRIIDTRSKVPRPPAGEQHEFASPVWLQTKMLTQRLFRQYWRDPSYLYAKLFISVILGIFNGFTFYKLGNSIQDMQNRMFTCFLIILFPPVIVNGIVPKFYINRALWEARELPSRIYGWFAFCTAQIVGEIPMAIIGSVIYWLLWYFPTGLPRDSSTSGYVFLMTLLFFLFQASWGQWITAFAPSFTVIANVLPFFFVVFSLFNGVVQSYAHMSVFWRYWLYYLNPSTYWIGGVLAATLNGAPVRCTDAEAVHFNPPPGQTCLEYAGAFINSLHSSSSAGSSGYLLPNTLNATSNCGFCPMSVGNDYLGTINISHKDKWGYFGIFLGFCVSNWFLVYFMIYTVRIRGWSFGLGTVFGVLGKIGGAVVGAVKKVVAPKSKATVQE
ncbi:ABC multidrug transporter [Xylona heveae TC161]|uniref:ABC multidrug transporter atrF n=1 Tax=Xylona heveae (strain CBS 132557 / TC161) TaxID=1328760 RepID=A0A165IRP2_XYLHT|nr:ABC multidrug transporter [Xylona heveae TC161]KZF25288.1 ABC multidrug transporter [Xylona heveae TC161]